MKSTILRLKWHNQLPISRDAFDFFVRQNQVQFETPNKTMIKDWDNQYWVFDDGDFSGPYTQSEANFWIHIDAN